MSRWRYSHLSLTALLFVFRLWSSGSGLLSNAAEPSPDRAASDRLGTAVEALKRLKGVDLESNPSLKTAVLRVLESTKGSPQFVELVREFKIKGQGAALLEMALHHPQEASGVDAARLLLAEGEAGLFKTALRSADADSAVVVLGNTSQKETVPLLEPVLADPESSSKLRQQAVHALAQTLEGAEALLRLASSAQANTDMKAMVATELRTCRWPDINARAAALAPPVTDGESLPPVQELARLKGNPARGAELFASDATACNKCHQIDGKGTDFGPNLSEIGTKLAKEAIYQSILEPSAGIAFGFEAWQVELRNGDEAYGLLASETADEVAIKGTSGIITRYPKKEIINKTQQKTSAMPSGLAQTMSRQDLVDLVEYLASRKAPPHSSTAGK